MTKKGVGAAAPIFLGMVFATALGLVGCQPSPSLGSYATVNSRYTESQPALSGDGRYLAFISNRAGKQELVLYDLAQQQAVRLPQLYRQDAIVDSPSLSRSARYLVYGVSDRRQPRIELYDRIAQRRQILTLGYRSPVRNPSVSADGRYVVFETARNGQWDVEVIDRGPSVVLDLPQGIPPGLPALSDPEAGGTAP